MTVAVREHGHKDDPNYARDFHPGTGEAPVNYGPGITLVDDMPVARRVPNEGDYAKRAHRLFDVERNYPWLGLKYPDDAEVIAQLDQGAVQLLDQGFTPKVPLALALDEERLRAIGYDKLQEQKPGEPPKPVDLAGMLAHTGGQFVDPETREMLNPKNPKHDQWAPDPWAQWYAPVATILVNPRIDIKTGFTTEQNFADIFRHEYGHYLMYLADGSPNGPWWARDRQYKGRATDAWRDFKAHLYNWAIKASDDEVKTTISEYGLTGARHTDRSGELWGEYFTILTRPHRKPLPFEDEAWAALRSMGFVTVHHMREHGTKTLPDGSPNPDYYRYHPEGTSGRVSHAGAPGAPEIAVGLPSSRYFLGEYLQGRVVLRQDTLDALDQHGMSALYDLAYDERGTPMAIPHDAQVLPEGAVKGAGGTAALLAHEVGHAWERQFDVQLMDPEFTNGLGYFDGTDFIGYRPDWRRAWPSLSELRTEFGNPSEAAADAFSNYVQVPELMVEQVRDWVSARLTPEWRAIVEQLRAHPDPRDWIEQQIAEHGTKGEPGYWRYHPGRDLPGFIDQYGYGVSASKPGPVSGDPSMDELPVDDPIRAILYDRAARGEAAYDPDAVYGPIDAAHVNKNALVTIYRGAPRSVDRINPGDWVTQVHDLAADYGEHVVSAQVPARQLYLSSVGSNLPVEWVWWPTAHLHRLGLAAPFVRREDLQEHGDPQTMSPDEYAAYHPGTGVSEPSSAYDDYKAEREAKQQAEADAINARIAEFREQGGHIESESEHGVSSDALVDSLAERMSPQWEQSRGVQFTRQAIRRGRQTRREKPGVWGGTITAWHGDDIAGAVNWNVMSEFRIPFGKTYKRRYVYLDYVGSTGILKGVGSALTREVLLFAAQRKLPLLLTADPPALTYWQDVWGMQRNPFNFDLGGTMSRMSGSDTLMGLSKVQVADLAKRLREPGSLINVFTEIAVEVQWDPDEAPWREQWLALFREHGDPDRMSKAAYEALYHPGTGIKGLVGQVEGLPAPMRASIAKEARRLYALGYRATVPGIVPLESDLVPEGYRDLPQREWPMAAGTDPVTGLMYFNTAPRPPGGFGYGQTAGDFFRHEYMHVLWTHFTPTQRQDLVSLLLRWSKGNPTRVTEGLSKYATNDLFGFGPGAGEEAVAEAFAILTAKDYKPGALPFDAKFMDIVHRFPFEEHGDPQTMTRDEYARFHPGTGASEAPTGYDAIAQFERKWASISPKSEAFLIVGADGTPLQSGAGTAKRATSQHIDMSLLGPGVTLTHFHPEPSYSTEAYLSHADIDNALKRGYTIRAFQKNGSWQQFVPHPPPVPGGPYLDLTERETIKKARAWADLDPMRDPNDEYRRLLVVMASRKGTLTSGTLLMEHGDPERMSADQYRALYHPGWLAPEGSPMQRLLATGLVGTVKFYKSYRSGPADAPTDPEFTAQDVQDNAVLRGQIEVTADSAVRGAERLNELGFTYQVPYLRPEQHTNPDGSAAAGVYHSPDSGGDGHIGLDPYIDQWGDLGKGYVFAAGLMSEGDTFRHEYGHALYYSNPEFRDKVNDLLGEWLGHAMQAHHPDDYPEWRIRDWVQEQISTYAADGDNKWGNRRWPYRRHAELWAEAFAMMTHPGYGGHLPFDHEVWDLMKEYGFLRPDARDIREADFTEHGHKGDADYAALYHPGSGLTRLPAGLTNTELVRRLDALPPDAVVALYHGTVAENADKIVAQKLLKPDDLNSVGLTTNWQTAKQYGGYHRLRGGVVVEVLLRRSELGFADWHEPEGGWPRLLVAPPEVYPRRTFGEEYGGSGYDSLLVTEDQRWPGLALIDARRADYQYPVREHGDPDRDPDYYTRFHPRKGHLIQTDLSFLGPRERSLVEREERRLQELGYTLPVRVGKMGIGDGIGEYRSMNDWAGSIEREGNPIWHPGSITLQPHAKYEGYAASKNLGDVFRHEYGHALMDALVEGGSYSAAHWSQYAAIEVMDEWLRNLPERPGSGRTPRWHWLREHVSEYAADWGGPEQVAEAFMLITRRGYKMGTLPFDKALLDILGHASEAMREHGDPERMSPEEYARYHPGTGVSEEPTAYSKEDEQAIRAWTGRATEDSLGLPYVHDNSGLMRQALVEPDFVTSAQPGELYPGGPLVKWGPENYRMAAENRAEAKADAERLLRLTAEAPPSTVRLFRGLSVSDEAMARLGALSKGDRYAMNLSAWSSDAQSALRYAAPYEGERKTGKNPVLFILVPGAHALSTEGHTPLKWEQEYLSSGLFEVRNIATEGMVWGRPLYQIVFRQIEPFRSAADVQRASIREHGDKDDPDYAARYHPGAGVSERPEGYDQPALTLDKRDYPEGWDPGLNDFGHWQEGMLPTAYLRDIVMRYEPELQTPREYTRSEDKTRWPRFKADIAANGVKERILVMVNDPRDTRHHHIEIEGHRRLLASYELGLPTVPVEVRYFGTEGRPGGPDLFADAGVHGLREHGSKDDPNYAAKYHPGPGHGRLDPSRAGQCYTLAGRYIMDNQYDTPGLTLVHGSIQGFDNPRIGHAWVVLSDGNIWEPFSNQVWNRQHFDALFNPLYEHQYSAEQAQRYMLHTRVWGPWLPTEGYSPPGTKFWKPLKEHGSKYLADGSPNPRYSEYHPRADGAPDRLRATGLFPWMARPYDGLSEGARAEAAKGAERLAELGFSAPVGTAILPPGMTYPSEIDNPMMSAVYEKFMADIPRYWVQPPRGIFLSPEQLNDLFGVVGVNHPFIALKDKIGGEAPDFFGGTMLGDVFRHEYAHLLDWYLEQVPPAGPDGNSRVSIWERRKDLGNEIANWVLFTPRDEVIRLVSPYAAGTDKSFEQWAEMFRVVTQPNYKMGTLPFDQDMFDLLRDAGLMRSEHREHGDKATMSPAEYAKFHPGGTASGLADSPALGRLESLLGVVHYGQLEGDWGRKWVATEAGRALGLGGKPEVVADLAPYIADGELALRRAASHVPQLLSGAYRVFGGSFGSGIYAFTADDPQKGWKWYRQPGTTDLLMTLRKAAKVYDLVVPRGGYMSEPLTKQVYQQLKGWGYERLAKAAFVDIGLAAMLNGYDAVVVHEGTRVREVVVLNRAMLRIQDPSVPLAEHGSKDDPNYWRYHPDTADYTIRSWEEQVATEERTLHPRVGYGDTYGPERGLLVDDATGRVLWQGTGDSGDPLKPVLKDVPHDLLGPGVTLTHFHPDPFGYGALLSPNDIRAALHYGMTVRAFEADGSWHEVVARVSGFDLGVSDQDLWTYAREQPEWEQSQFAAMQKVIEQIVGDRATFRRGGQPRRLREHGDPDEDFDYYTRFHPERAAKPTEGQAAFAKTVADWPRTQPWTATKADVIAGKVPGVSYEAGQSHAPRDSHPYGGFVVGRADQTGAGGFAVTDAFFSKDEQGRMWIMYHEAGHEATIGLPWNMGRYALPDGSYQLPWMFSPLPRAQISEQLANDWAGLMLYGIPQDAGPEQSAYLTTLLRYGANRGFPASKQWQAEHYGPMDDRRVRFAPIAEHGDKDDPNYWRYHPGVYDPSAVVVSGFGRGGWRYELRRGAAEREADMRRWIAEGNEPASFWEFYGVKGDDELALYAMKSAWASSPGFVDTTLIEDSVLAAGIGSGRVHGGPSWEHDADILPMQSLQPSPTSLRLVRDMYARTQADLARGPATLTLYRGFYKDEPAWRAVLESWTTDPTIAQRFAGAGGRIYTVTVPREAIFMDVRSAGGGNENEVVVLGSKRPPVRRWANWRLWHASLGEHGDPQTMPRAEYEARFHPGTGMGEQPARHGLFTEPEPFAGFPADVRLQIQRGIDQIERLGLNVPVWHTGRVDPDDQREGTNGQTVPATRSIKLGTFAIVDHFTTARDYGDVFRHEYGHLVYDALSKPATMKVWGAYAEYNKLSHLDKMRQVSAYAADGGLNEWFSEVFAAITSPTYHEGVIPYDKDIWAAIRDSGLMR